MMSTGTTRLVALFASIFVAFTLISVDFAEARRGGSFGSRGTRTFDQAPPTRTAPNQVGPVERSMTPNPGPTARQNTPAAQQRPGGLFGGMGGLMTGLMFGGLIGMLMGYGFGGMAGLLGFAVQALLLLLLASLVLGWMRRRNTPATANASVGGSGLGRGVVNRESANGRENETRVGGKAGSFSIPAFGGSSGPASAAKPAVQTRDIEMGQEDLDTFERRLGDVQRAFGDEDHAALRKFSTPEMVSFFSEELADNAKRGVRNEVRDVHLVQADIAEAWNEGNEDYATAAFRYESTDVMRDRKTGEIVEGEDEPTETVELWTFVRRRGEDWKLSAIQEA